MKKIEFFKRKGYNPLYETIGGEVLMDGICVGKWSGYINRILFYGGDDGEHYCGKYFDTLEACAKWIVECGRFDHDYKRWDGALCFFFNTKTGYNHLADYLRTFPLIKKYTIEIEA